MKKIEPNRYPHSATLFRFCKEALEHKYEGNVKVIDQDVGAILGYDPADCSHWKKGKKNIRSLSTLKSISDHLNVDERLLIDIASGSMGLEEAMFEYKGYGSFELSGKNLDNLKKEFFKNAQNWQQTDGSTRAFEEVFDIDRNAVTTLVNTLLEKGNFTEAPIYLPELYNLFTNINLENNPGIKDAINVVDEDSEDGVKRVRVQFRDAEMKPYIRFLTAKELFKYLHASNDPLMSRFAKMPPEILDIHANIFAGMILIPAKMLRKEVERIDCSLDLVNQLSNTFWVSKALMNQRLRDYMEHLN